MNGAAVGMYNGDSLKIKSDMELLGPTLFASVPRLYNRLYEAIKQRFSQVNAFRRAVVN
jgi:long-chain acyl-CoA synthetase